MSGHWLGLPAELVFADGAPHEPPATLELRAGPEPVTLLVGNGAVRSFVGAAEHPDAGTGFVTAETSASCGV